MHKRTCFQPVDISSLSPEEKRKAVKALMFLTEKRDDTVKGQMVYNNKMTLRWLNKEDSSSPTTHLESIMIITVIVAKECRDIMTADVPNTFIQAHVKPGEEKSQECLSTC